MTVISINDGLIKPPIKGEPQRRHNLDALTIAQNELGTAFNREQMTVNGCWVSIGELMRDYVNKKRKAEGRPQVLYNPSWEVK